MAEEKKKKSGSAKQTAHDDDFYDYDSGAKSSPRKSTGQGKRQNGQQKNRAEAEERPPLKEAKEAKKEKQGDPYSVGNQFAVILLAVLAVFIVICFAFRNDVGIIGLGISYGFFGLFGIGAFLVPFLLFQLALFWKRDVVSGAVKYKYLMAIFVLLFSSVLVHAIYCIAAGIPKYTFATAFSWDTLKALFAKGMDYKGGGFLGGIVANAFICAFGYPGTVIFGLLFLVAFVMSLFGLTPSECMQRFLFYRQRNRSARRVQKENAEKRRAEQEKKRAEQAAREEERRRFEREYAKSQKSYQTASAHEQEQSKKRCANIDSDIFSDDAEFGKNDAPVTTTIKAVKKEKVSRGESAEESRVNLGEIFDKKEDEAVLAKYVGDDDDLFGDDGKSAQSEFYMTKRAIGVSAQQNRAQEQDENIIAMPVGKVRSAEKIKPIEQTDKVPSASVEKTPKTEDAIRIIPAQEAPITAKKEPAQQENDVISIRPPEMSVPAPMAEDMEEEPEILPPSYEFPPLDLLQKPQKSSSGDVSSELRENADKIIQTLDSFNVHVSISNVSRGPTITRYEIEPSAGTRVRSIMNLLDDIALSLATSGVRSDGIIAGKSAIGIEVPNKITNTVFVRELIEDGRFEAAKSKLTASLGMDVSGAPVYLDIAKMPHLLIAGATGQGKSVCINSLIISLLYKARPDEVKLILIDPKKVELNVYNGIPHLLVPVVFDPKKAAGSLHWAVQEMERRFELIEAQNVRNIAQYNAAVADDPHKEKMPQVVIIIDELADLMMSAPDDVETSICRLAQKARAAGMHLIIGTQRPSVDVITGLIKANIPSRIAFTVSSQIDSRTIIDTQGAEKLIGRGDMLFAPVGSSKPIRVQGAFVSEKEIENIIGFIKNQSRDCSYSDDVMKQIEKAAAVCGQKKGKGGAAAASANLDDGGDMGEEVDPMLDSAIELAVDSGKISTSLIQRRLSLGYGRAAKLIDVMERKGIVSAPEGQKPRAVLITREQYMEMKMRQSGEEPAVSADNDDEPPFDV